MQGSQWISGYLQADAVAHVQTELPPFLLHHAHQITGQALEEQVVGERHVEDHQPSLIPDGPGGGHVDGLNLHLEFARFEDGVADTGPTSVEQLPVAAPWLPAGCLAWRSPSRGAATLNATVRCRGRESGLRRR